MSGAPYKIVSCSSGIQSLFEALRIFLTPQQSTGLGSVGNIKQANPEAVWQTDSAEKKAVVEIELAEEQKIKRLQIGTKVLKILQLIPHTPLKKQATRNMSI